MAHVQPFPSLKPNLSSPPYAPSSPIFNFPTLRSMPLKMAFNAAMALEFTCGAAKRPFPQLSSCIKGPIPRHLVPELMQKTHLDAFPVSSRVLILNAVIFPNSSVRLAGSGELSAMYIFFGGSLKVWTPMGCAGQQSNEIRDRIAC